MSKIVDELQIVLDSAKALKFADDKISSEELLPEYDAYLLSLEKWQEAYRNELDVMRETLPEDHPERVALRGLVQQLVALHSQITQHAEERLDLVKGEIGSVNVRARAIKKYVDVLPHRVSVTSRKKG